jgi:hypothetical protein
MTDGMAGDKSRPDGSLLSSLMARRRRKTLRVKFNDLTMIPAQGILAPVWWRTKPNDQTRQPFT